MFLDNNNKIKKEVEKRSGSEGLNTQKQTQRTHDGVSFTLKTNVQVAEPLRAMVVGAPLEDARHLAQRYDRMRQEAEAQVIIYETILSSNTPAFATSSFGHLN